MSRDEKRAGPMLLLLPLLACPAGIAVALIPSSFTNRLGEFLLFGPLPLLAMLCWKGRRGAWIIVALVAAALPYVAFVIDVIEGKPTTHIPL